MPYYPELLICSDFDTKETIILNKNGESISDEKYDLFSPYKDDFVNNVNYDLDQLYYEFYNIKELN